MKYINIMIGLLAILSLPSCYHEDDYLPTNINPDKVLINLVATLPALPADGLSYTYVQAELPVDAVDARSTVIFTTTKGTFDNNAKTISVVATLIDSSGTNRRIAKARLISSTSVETAEITASVGNVTKTIDVSFTNLAFDSFLTLSSSGDIPADGASVSYITVQQPVETIADYSSITFTTTTGLFDNGTKTITKSSATILQNGSYKKIAQVRLTSSKNIETASVEAAIKGTSKTIAVNFIQALPDSIKLNMGGLAISQGYNNVLSIGINLLRTTGTPSINDVAEVSVTDPGGVVHGSFINYTNRSDATGAVSNKFTLGNDTYKGPLKVKATATGTNGKPLADSTTITAQ